jgi:PAS domain S-box-containing protein
VFTPQCVLKRLVRSKYDARVLYEQLHQLMGDTYLSETLIDVSISAYEIETRTPITFSSHRARIDPRFDYRLVDVVMASCSAPTYFPPYYLQNRTRTQDMWCIDGGVVNSNPCRRVINEALHRYPGVPLTRFLVISIGTGNGSRPIHGHKARRFNTIEWIRPIITIVLDASSVNTHYELCESMTSFTTASSFGYLRLQTRLVAGSIHMDDASQDNLRGLYIDAQRLLVEHSILIQHLVIVLQELDEYASSSASSITSTCESLLLLSETSSSDQTITTTSSTPENQPCVNQQQQPITVPEPSTRKTTISSIPNYYQFVMRLSDAIVCTNHIGIITCVNQSALRLFEYTNDSELIGRNCKVLIASQLIREHHDTYVEQYTGRHSCTPRTVQALTKNGQQINVLLVLSEQWINANERIFIALFNKTTL